MLFRSNLRVLVDEATIKVRKTEEGLNVLNFTGFGPILDSFDLLHRHRKSRGRKVVAQILCSVGMELALQGVGEESMLSQSPEDFLDMFLMKGLILGKD